MYIYIYIYIYIVVYRSGVVWVSLRSTQTTPLLNNLLTIGLRPLMMVSHSFNIKFNHQI